MVTALVLQLIQCIIKLPAKSDDEEECSAQAIIIAVSYEQAMKTAHHFLSVFLKKLVTNLVKSLSHTFLLIHGVLTKTTARRIVFSYFTMKIILYTDNTVTE